MILLRPYVNVSSKNLHDHERITGPVDYSVLTGVGRTTTSPVDGGPRLVTVCPDLT